MTEIVEAFGATIGKQSDVISFGDIQSIDIIHNGDRVLSVFIDRKQYGVYGDQGLSKSSLRINPGEEIREICIDASPHSNVVVFLSFRTSLGRVVEGGFRPEEEDDFQRVKKLSGLMRFLVFRLSPTDVLDSVERLIGLSVSYVPPISHSGHEGYECHCCKEIPKFERFSCLTKNGIHFCEECFEKRVILSLHKENWMISESPPQVHRFILEHPQQKAMYLKINGIGKFYHRSDLMENIDVFHYFCHVSAIEVCPDTISVFFEAHGDYKYGAISPPSHSSLHLKRLGASLIQNIRLSMIDVKLEVSDPKSFYRGVLVFDLREELKKGDLLYFEYGSIGYNRIPLLRWIDEKKIERMEMMMMKRRNNE